MKRATLFITHPVTKIIKHVSCFLFFFSSMAVTFANPTGGVVTQGNASISQTAHTTTINQSSQKAIIQWNQFNIGSSEKTHFQQPASGITLNRINPTMGASQIYGQLTATGKIILVNQAGIFFGRGALVDVGGIVASTSDISDANFLAGRYIFDKASPYAGSVINEGTIRAAQFGLVALMGTGVRNDGLIEARMGNVVLGSGNKFTIDLYGDQLVNFTVDEAASSPGLNQQKQKMNDGVANNGAIIADGGRVLISARSAQNMMDNVINMKGVVQAKAVYQRGGEIILAGEGGTVNISGKMDASGKASQQHGGKIKVAGSTILIHSGALLDASGSSSGGEVLIGGNLQGKVPIGFFAEKQQWANAKEVTIQSHAVINADALSLGNGGSIIIWSDQKTHYAGFLSAKGGISGGNGGFAEISGKKQLAFTGQVNLRAPHGNTGTLLLDPENLTIQAAGVTNASSFGSTYVGNQANSILTISDLLSALASSNVLVQTGSVGNQAGDITVADSISWSNANTLTLSAYRHIVINSGINITNNANGSLILHADNTGTGTGTVTNNGTITISGTGKIDIFYNPSSYTSPTVYTNSAAISPATLTAYMLVNNPTNLSDVRNNLSGNYALGRSIDMTSVPSFTPIGSNPLPFSGKFNGNFNTIRNLTINTASGMLGGVTVDAVGLFGATNNAAIEKLTLMNLNVTNTGLSGLGGIGSVTGGLIGYAQGSTVVRNVYVSGNVTYSNTGLGVASNIGGLIGYNDALSTLDQVQVNANVTSTAQLSGILGAVSRIGGLIGFNQGTITNAAVAGTVAINGLLDLLSSIGGLAGMNSGAINTSYSVISSIGGTLALVSAKGGFIGTHSGTLSNDYWNSQLLAGFSTCGVGVCTNAVARNTTQMRSQATYTGFNFSGTWGINSTNNNQYPYLLSFGPRIISGTLPSSGGSINLYNNGSLISSQAIGAGTSTFTFSVDYGTIADNDALLLYLSGYSSVNNVVAAAPIANGNLTNLDLTANNQLTIGADNITSLSNSFLNTAKGGLSTTNILFSTSSNNLVIGNATNTVVNVSTTGQTSYSLDGTLGYTGGGSGGLVFNGPVAINGGTSVTSPGDQTYASSLSLSNNASLSGVALSLQNIELNSSTLSLNTSSLSSQIAGLVSGTGGLTKLGTGTLSIVGANTYSGSTTLSNGTLSVANNTALGSGNLLFNGGTLNAAVNGITLANNFTLQNNSSIAGSNNLTLSGLGTLNNGNTLTSTNTSITTLSGNLSGSGNLTENAVGGTLAISGVNNNSYSGTTTLTSGTLQIDVATNGLGTGALALNGGNLQSTVAAVLANNYTLGGNTTINGSNNLTLSGLGTLSGGNTLTSINTGVTTLSGNVSGSGNLTENAVGGVLAISGANNSSYSGITTLTSGTLEIGVATNALGGGSLALNGGNLQSTVAAALANNYTLGGNVIVNGSNNITLNGLGTLNNGNTLTSINTGITTLSGNLTGSGNLTENAVGGTLAISGANNSGYSGTTTLTSGTLQIGVATNALGSGVLALNGGNLQSTLSAALTNNYSLGGNTTINGSNNLTLSGLGTLNNGNTLTSTNTGMTTLSGNINGSGNLAENAIGGTLAISGSDNSGYSGATTLTSGILQIGVATNALGSGSLALNGGNLQSTLSAALTNNYTLGGNATINGSNNLILSGLGTLNVGNTLTSTNTGITTLSGNLTGSGNLTENGVSGTFAISGANNSSYSGTTTLTNGTLQIGVATNALGSGSFVLNGGNLQSTLSATLANNYILGGNTTINGSNNLTLSGLGTLNTGNTLTSTNTGMTTLSGNVSGAGNLTENAVGGTLAISGANNSGYSGTTTLTNGTLQIGVATNALGSGTLALNGGNLQSTVAAVLGNNFTLSGNALINGSNNLTLSGAGTLNVGNTLTSINTGVTTLNGNLVGSGNLTENAVGGTLAISGANNSGYSGTTTLTNGTLQIGSATNVLGSGALVLNGGNLQSTLAATLANNFTLGGNATINGSNNITLNGGGNLNANTLGITNIAITRLNGILNGTGGITANAPGGMVELNNTNTYSGNTTLTAGTLQLNVANAINNQSNVIVNTNGVLDMNGTNQTIGSLAGNGSVIMDAILSMGNSTTTTFSGDISGNGTLIKTGSGTFTLSGNNTYSGDTIISNGVLRAANAGALGTGGDIDVLAGASLNLAFSNAALTNSQTITLSGNGAANDGALMGSGSNTQLNNPIVLADNTLINMSGLQMNNTITGGFNLALSSSDVLNLPTIQLTNHNQLAVNAGGAVNQQPGTLLDVDSTIISANDGIQLTGDNTINQFTAINGLSGNISLINSSPLLSISTITQNAPTGNVSVTNTGSLTTAGTIQTTGGNVTLITLSNNGSNSPMLLNGNINTQGGSITGSAANPGNMSGAITVNGLLSTFGGPGQGVLTIDGGVTLNKAPIVGGGNITLATMGQTVTPNPGGGGNNPPGNGTTVVTPPANTSGGLNNLDIPGVITGAVNQPRTNAAITSGFDPNMITISTANYSPNVNLFSSNSTNNVLFEHPNTILNTLVNNSISNNYTPLPVNYWSTLPLLQGMLSSPRDLVLQPDAVPLLAALLLLIIAAKQAAMRKKLLTRDLIMDVRTSLHDISGFTQLLQEAKIGQISTQQKDYLDEIIGGAKHILTQLDTTEKGQASSLKTLLFNFRTDLYTIQGFAKLFANKKMGELTSKQNEFISEVLQESNKILALVA